MNSACSWSFTVALGVFAWLALLTSGTAATPPGYTISDLGQGWATGINAAGQVVKFPAWDINNLGQSVGVGTIAFGVDSVAYAVNDNGQIVGFGKIEHTPLDYHDHAFYWTGGVAYDFAGRDSKAYDINSNGVVVGWMHGVPGTVAFAWQDGRGFLGLNVLAEGSSDTSEARAINELGQVVGFSTLNSRPGSPVHGFLWTDIDTDWRVDPGEAVDMGMPSGATQVLPYAINRKAQVVGVYRDSTNLLRPFVWENGAFTDLQTFLAAGTDWDLQEAQDINDRGWIVGSGVNPLGEWHAFLLTPEPATLALLAVGGLLAICRRKAA